MAVEATAKEHPLASRPARDLPLPLEHMGPLPLERMEPLPLPLPMEVATARTMSTNIQRMEDMAVGDNSLISVDSYIELYIVSM